MSRRLAFACLLLNVLAFLPAAQAGTEADPEIADDPGDSISPILNEDIAKFWVDNALGATSTGDPALVFHMTTGGDFNHRPALFAISERFRVTFGSSNAAALAGAAEFYVHISPSNPSQTVAVTAVPNPTQESVSCRFGRAPAAGGSVDIPAEAVLEPLFPAGNHFGCLVPVATLGVAGGDKLTGFVIRQQLVTRGPLSGGDDIPPTVLATFDTAPNTGVGRDYTVPGVPGAGGVAAPGVLYHTLTGETITNTTRFAAATTQSIQFNWTSVFRNATLEARVQRDNGTLSFVVLDGANQTVTRETFAATANLTRVVLGATPGAWRILVNATGFQGNLTFSIGAPGATPAGSLGSASTSASGGPSSSTTGGTTGQAGGASGGSGSSTQGKGTPGPGLLWGLAALAAALLVGRRRA